MSDIRKWFMKQHDKGNGAASKPEKLTSTTSKPEKSAPIVSKPDKTVQGVQESSGRRKTSKYFAANSTEPTNKPKLDEVNKSEKSPAKRKTQQSNIIEEEVKPTLSKRSRKEDDDDFVLPSKEKVSVDPSPKKDGKRSQPSSVRAEAQTPDKKLKGASANKVVSKPTDKDEEMPVEKAVGRVSGGRGTGGAPGGGRGRGGGRGGFMNFGDRVPPPHKGEKEVPEGTPNCLAGLTFVISGTLDSLVSEEAEDLVKRHGGRITGSVSKKTNYLLLMKILEDGNLQKPKNLGNQV